MPFQRFLQFIKRPRMTLAEDQQMKRRAMKADLFFKRILWPDEETAFVSDEATLRDLSLAPDEDLIRKVQTYYGKTLSAGDFTKRFWVLLDELQEPITDEHPPTS